VLAAVSSPTFAVAAPTQMDFSKVVVKAQQLGETTWMLSGAGGNVGLSVGPDAVFIIDNDFTQVTPKIREARPSADFEARFGGGFVKPDAFVQMMLGVIAK
jgi:hypothetical protein